MFAFTDIERASLTETRSLSTDQAGREILVGLTLEETEFCMTHRRRFAEGERDHAGKRRYLELSEKHERARFAVLAAEDEREKHSPPLH